MVDVRLCACVYVCAYVLYACECVTAPLVSANQGRGPWGQCRQLAAVCVAMWLPQVWVDTVQPTKGGFTASLFLPDLSSTLPPPDPARAPGSAPRGGPRLDILYAVADLMAANIQGGRRVVTTTSFTACVQAPTCTLHE